MVFSRFVVALWFAALLAAFALNRFNPQGRPLGLALMLLLQTALLCALAVRLWSVGPRLPAVAVGAAALLLLCVTADQFALACGWW